VSPLRRFLQIVHAFLLVVAVGITSYVIIEMNLLSLVPEINCEP